MGEAADLIERLRQPVAGDVVEQKELQRLIRYSQNFQNGTKKIYEDPKTNGDMWYFELWRFLGDVESTLKLIGGGK